jgi:hypothetical protein
LGFPASRVVLFPSWPAAEAALGSDRARATWSRHVRVTGDFDVVWLRSGRLFGRGRDIEDMSAGQWRQTVFDDPHVWAAVHPQHERRKYLIRDGGPTLHRFVGLGRRGAAIERRAEMLADAGFCAAPQGLSHGFLAQRWMEGRPLTTTTAADLRRIAAYVAHLKRRFGTGAAECVDDVCDMALTNAREALGADTVGAFERLARSARQFPAERVAIDGRLLPHEWIATSTQLVKVDALDHHDDDFWPGCRDIAWDVAGAIVEFDWSGAPRDSFVAEYERYSADRTIRRRLPFYEAAYLAYRVGYATMARDALNGSPDGARFNRLLARYRHSLGSRLACARRDPRC